MGGMAVSSAAEVFLHPVVHAEREQLEPEEAKEVFAEDHPVAPGERRVCEAVAGHLAQAVVPARTPSIGSVLARLGRRSPTLRRHQRVSDRRD